MGYREVLDLLDEVDDSRNQVVYTRSGLVVNGRRFELVPEGDTIYSDLKYLRWDDSLWVEE